MLLYTWFCVKRACNIKIPLIEMALTFLLFSHTIHLCFCDTFVMKNDLKINRSQMQAKGRSDMSSAPAVDYALRIIECFAEKNYALGIADISNALNINKNAVSRVLGALTERGWLYCIDPVQKKYALTMRPFSLLSKCVEENELPHLAKPYVQALFEQTDNSTYLGVRRNENVIYLLHHNSVGDVRINARVGGAYPLHCSAPGKILLAWASEKDIADYFAHYATKRTANTVTEAADFLCEAEKIRTQGYALDLEEFGKGIVCVAAPVVNAEQQVVAAVGISSLTIYDNAQSLLRDKLPFVRDAAEKISLALGGKNENKTAANNEKE